MVPTVARHRTPIPGAVVATDDGQLGWRGVVRPRNRRISNPGRETVRDVRNHSAKTLDALIVRLVREAMAAWPKA